MADDEEQYTDEQSQDLTSEELFWESLGTGGKAVSVAKLRELAAARPVTNEDVQYLLSRYAYLDICNSDVAEIPPDTLPVKVIKTSNNWQIHDRGERLTLGVGRLAFGGYFSEGGEDEEDGGGGLVHPDGTLIKQFFDASAELIAMAAERWPAAAIISAYDPMRRAAWMAAESLGFTIDYVPTTEDRQIYRVIKERGGIKAVPPKLTP